MDERMRFVIRLKDGESMASLCREFNISRKTGYKILERYEQCGVEGLSDRARRPFRYANQLPEQIEAAMVAARREKPTWGARKIRERLLRRLPHAVKVPACSTSMDRHGLVSHPIRSRTRAQGTPLSEGIKPNDLWCTDYKGEFQLGDKRYCYPLTVTDHASRYLLLCEALESLEATLSRYTNRAITTAKVVEELIGLARTIREAVHRGEESGLTESEVAFYDALADNASAREVMQDDMLKLIARELSERIKAKASLDWTQRETVRADMRRTVRRLLAKYGYPPDAQEAATQLVIRQAELMAENVIEM